MTSVPMTRCLALNAAVAPDLLMSGLPLCAWDRTSPGPLWWTASLPGPQALKGFLHSCGLRSLLLWLSVMHMPQSYRCRGWRGSRMHTSPPSPTPTQQQSPAGSEHFAICPQNPCPSLLPRAGIVAWKGTMVPHPYVRRTPGQPGSLLAHGSPVCGTGPVGDLPNCPSPCLPTPGARCGRGLSGRHCSKPL